MRVHPITASRGTSLLALLMAFALVFSVAAASAVAAPEPESERGTSGPVYIDPELRDEVRSVESASESRRKMQALLVLDGSTDLADVAGDARAVAERLRESTAESQSPLTSQLRATSGFGFEVINQFWIINAVLVEFDASVDALDALASLPGVQRVVRNYEFTTPAVEVETTDLSASFEGDVTWGIDRIRADEAWDMGFDGAGVRVAVLDTGLNHTHPDLAGKLATDDPEDPTFPGGWMQFDPDGNLMSTEPNDSDFQVAHGTHVAGTVLGGDNHPNGAIGVAPGAILMSGLVLDGGSGTFTQVAAGMQWAIDPVDSDGNPAGEPADVVNMSLGAPGNYPEMIEPTINMRMAGVFPAFSSGNVTQAAACGRGFEVPNLGSGSPGNVFEAVAVGNTTRQDTVNDGSCGEWVDTAEHWGDDAPAHWPETYVVPDVSAPGTNVTSAGQGTGYNTISGTSMAAPHVAGAAAMLVQAGLGGDVDAMEEVLEDTSFWTNLYSEDRPDRRFGHGRIDVLEALTVAAVDTGIAGTVTGPEGPISGATVTIGDWTGTTNADGEFTRRVDPGEYDVTVSAFGFTTVTETVIVADQDELTEVTITLALADLGAISGMVTDAETGEAIEAATVDLVSTPLETTTDADGTYLMEEVPHGEYLIMARAEGYTSSEAVAVVVDGIDVTVDLTLTALPPAIGLWGDNGGLTAFLESEERPTVEYSYGDDLEGMPAIVVNAPAATTEEFLAFLDETAEAGVGVVLLDQWGNGYGIAELVSATGNPESRDDTDSAGATSFEILAEHEILGDLGPGDVVVHDNAMSAWGDHAWFEGFTSDEYGEVTVLADIASGGTTRGQSIAVRESEETGLRHVLMSSHGTTSYIGPSDYTDESLEIFLNAIDWASEFDTGPVESELEFSAPDEVFVGDSIIIEGTVTPGGDREVTLVEITEPVQANDDATAMVEEGEDFRFELVTSVPGERQFEIRVAESEDATAVVSERFTVTVLELVFSDVKVGDGFFHEIMWLADRGITRGYPDGTFRPLANISREAMAAFVYRYAGSPEVELPAESPFSDIDESEGFYTEMVWAYQEGITNGYPDGTFRPRANISREAIAAFLYRAAEEPDVDLPARSPFIDVPPTEGFYTEIIWMYQQGITTGWSGDEGLEFRPRASLTREAMAAFMYRFDDAVGVQAFED